MSGLTIGSLFSGIGGLELGLERAGLGPVVWQCESDPYARRVLAKHWPGVPCYEDITTMEDVPHVDIVCGGFPCQDLSYAGKGAGLGGERSGLFYELMRIVRLVRPRYVVLENVPALLTRGLYAVLGALAESGYDAQWDCIPASAVGAPHRRDRIFIVAELRNADGEGEPVVSLNGEASGVLGLVADADGERPSAYERRGRDQGGEAWPAGEAGGSRDVADPPGKERSGLSRRATEEHSFAGGSGFHVGGPASWWLSEPDVGRVADGIPSRVDRLRCLGNAVVPQVAEVIGRAIVEAA